MYKKYNMLNKICLINKLLMLKNNSVFEIVIFRAEK